MGELMEQLEATSDYVAHGNPCVISKIRDTEGEERARDVWEVLTYKHRPTSKKIEILANAGYNVTEQTVRRHVRRGCAGCASWLS